MELNVQKNSVIIDFENNNFDTMLRSEL